MNFSINLNICRVCLKSKQCQQISSDSVLNKKWFYTTRLQLDADDDLPKQLCENCIARLKISYDFVQAAQRSDKRLKAFLTKIHQDFVEVANTEKSQDETHDVDYLEENDDFLSLLKPNKSIENKSSEALFTNNSDCDNADEDGDDEIKESTIPKSKVNQLSVLKSHNQQHHHNINSDDHGKLEISSALIKNEQDQIEGDTETDLQEFEVAIDDEDYQFYDGSVHFVEGIEPTNATNEVSIATNSIDIEEIHIQEYDMQDEANANNEINSQNDEVSVRINAGEDGFLKEYEGSMSDGGNNETIDFIDEVSFQDLPSSEYQETDESPKEIISEEPQYHMKFATSNIVDEFKPKILRKHNQNRTSSGSSKGSTTRVGSKGRPSLPPNTRFLCVRCNRDFSTKTNLNRHLITHEGLRPFKCKECFKSFTQNGTLKQHMLIHTGEKPYVCEFCNRGFNQSKSLIFHLRRHTGEKPFHCEFCSLDFRQKDGLKNHILRHHMGKSIGNKYLCIICKKVLNNKTELQMHMKKHVNNHRSMSSGALQTGEQNAEVILELINENDEYQNETIYSDEMSLSVSNVTSATHVVDITATSASEPSRAKKYQCCKCFKCFAIKKNLIRHLSIHEMTVSEMFQCHECEIAFDTNYALKLHLVRTHKQVVENLNKCEECDIVFHTPSELNKHMDESHQHLCVECPNERFKSEKMLMEHMLEHELEDEEIMKFS